MKPMHTLASIFAFIVLFFASLTFFYSSEETIDAQEFGQLPHQQRTQSSVNISKDNRLLEPSEVTSKTNQVKDEPSALFNDPAISQAWGLKKADAGRAWTVSKGSKDIIVAVIDTGIDVQHEDLKKNLWINKGEIPNNGIDDDHNGFVDDVYGWNFVSNNNSLDDNHGHGTHIAGIIGAEAGNNKGISGISPNVSVMILKYFDPKVPNTDNLRNTVQAIKYAVKMGANIINYSGGGTEFSQDEYNAISEATKKGILFVAAAGNERSNSDKFHYYPADYKLENIVSVTAIDPSTEVLSSSNYGTETVDIAAPGQNILSTLPGNSYGFMTGTSQATAFVSGAAALIMANKQAKTAVDIKKYILATGDATTSLAAKTRTSRQLNLFKCLTILDKGVSASGVVTVNSNKLQFGSGGANGNDPSLRVNRAGASVEGFGKDLMEILKKQKQQERLGTGLPTSE